MNESDAPVEPGDITGSPPLLPLSRRAQQPDATAPDGSEIRLLADGRHSATKSSMVEVTLPAGQVSRPVYHRTVEEIWYILEGGGYVWRCPPGADSLVPEPVLREAEGLPPQAVSPGDTLVIPTGWRFQFSAAADAPLRFLCHTTPPWPGDDEAIPAERGGLGEATV